MTRDERRVPLDTRDLAKLAITVVFLPLIAFLVVHGSTTGESQMIGVALAMISLLGLLWGSPPKIGGGKDDS